MAVGVVFRRTAAIFIDFKGIFRSQIILAHPMAKQELFDEGAYRFNKK